MTGPHCIIHRDRPYLQVHWPSHAAATAALRDILRGYPARSEWRKALLVVSIDELSASQRERLVASKEPDQRERTPHVSRERSALTDAQMLENRRAGQRSRRRNEKAAGVERSRGQAPMGARLPAKKGRAA